MTQTLISVSLFVILLAFVPLGVRWVQRRSLGGGGISSSARIISAIAVGPQQRVVIIEVGPAGARTWLTLGVTAQNVTCLHSVQAPEPEPEASSLGPKCPVVV
jgi:flagellar protein FliO/FliZ